MSPTPPQPSGDDRHRRLTELFARATELEGAARAAFLAARPRLYEVLLDCSSGRELVGRGWEDDVATSAAHDVTPFACRLDEGEFSLAR